MKPARVTENAGGFVWSRAERRGERIGHETQKRQTPDVRATGALVRQLLRLIRGYLEAGVMVNGVVMERHEGSPQGGHEDEVSPPLSRNFDRICLGTPKM